MLLEGYANVMSTIAWGFLILIGVHDVGVVVLLCRIRAEARNCLQTRLSLLEEAGDHPALSVFTRAICPAAT
jgi:hypothetical protein